MKQKELQARTGLSQKYLSQIENDAVDPRVSVLKKIAQALQVSADSLLDLNAVEQPATESSSKRAKRTKSTAKV